MRDASGKRLRPRNVVVGRDAANVDYLHFAGGQIFEEPLVAWSRAGANFRKR
jgi:hypothetical protein